MISILLLFVTTVFFHIWDDFGRQGIMASMKQKKWWKEQSGYNDHYKNDWIPALIAHSFSWATMISIPSFIFIYIRMNECSSVLLFALFIQAAIHFYIDNLKCNKLKINLCQDQCLHIWQIIIEVLLAWCLSL